MRLQATSRPRQGFFPGRSPARRVRQGELDIPADEWVLIAAGVARPRFRVTGPVTGGLHRGHDRPVGADRHPRLGGADQAGSAAARRARPVAARRRAGRGRRGSGAAGPVARRNESTLLVPGWAREVRDVEQAPWLTRARAVLGMVVDQDAPTEQDHEIGGAPGSVYPPSGGDLIEHLPGAASSLTRPPAHAGTGLIEGGLRAGLADAAGLAVPLAPDEARAGGHGQRPPMAGGAERPRAAVASRPAHDSQR
jgi:hypothetical protein